MSSVAAAKLVAPSAAAAARFLPSVSFSGAGFLGCYHMGAAACLLKHGHLLRPGEVPRDDDDANPGWPPILTGVSAGSLVAAALSAGVSPDDGMSVVLEVSRRTRQHGGALDVLRPGFSLVDQVEDLILMGMKRALGGTGKAGDDYDIDLFRKRNRGGRNLRIGLTDRRLIVKRPMQLHGVPEAYVYVDGYRDVEDAVAACILSSYIPGMTGTVRGTACPHNAAVRRSWDRVREMERLGFVKDGITGASVVKNNATGSDSEIDNRSDVDTQNGNPSLYYWDGGLADVFPRIDDSTVIVSPVNGLYSNPSISPPLPEEPIDELDERLLQETKSNSLGPIPVSNGSNGKNPYLLPTSFVRRYLDILPKTVRAHAVAKLGVNQENAETLVRMMKSSDDSFLQERFQSGYDDATRFLKDRDMLSVFS